MPVSASQEAAFTGATLGFTMDNFSTTILLMFYSILYLWMTWVIITQWKAWSNQKILFYDFLTRSTRAVVLTLFLGFFMQ